MAKNCDIKKLKTIPWPTNFFSNLFSNTNGGFLTPQAETTQRMTINVKKNAKNLSKNDKSRNVKMLRTIPLALETLQ